MNRVLLLLFTSTSLHKHLAVQSLSQDPKINQNIPEPKKITKKNAATIKMAAVK